MKKESLTKSLWGIICMILFCPMTMLAQDYSKYTQVPGNYIPLDPSANSTTSHIGCQYESANDNVGYIRNATSSTYHINVTKAGSYNLQMGIRKYHDGIMRVIITDEATNTKEFQQDFNIPESSNYATQVFKLSNDLTVGYKTLKLEYYNSEYDSFLMNYNNLTLTFNAPVVASWDFTNSASGYEQVAGSASPFLSFYPGMYSFGKKADFTLSTGGKKSAGIGSAIINENIDLEIRQAYGENDGENITDGSKHCIYYEISVPTYGFSSLNLTAQVSHNQSNHQMYAVYSVDNGETWEGATSINLNNRENLYSPISIDLPTGYEKVLVRLLPSSNWYYYLQSCTVTGEALPNIDATLDANGYSTFYSTLAYSVSNAEAYTAKVNGDYVTLTKIEDNVIPANTGVMLVGSADATATLTPASTSNDYSTINDLTGVAVRTAASTYAGKDIICYSKSKGTFVTYTGEFIPANKAFLLLDPLSSGAKARTLSIGFGEEADGISNVTTVVNADVRYNLNGQRINTNAKGIVIVNGKKCIVK